MAEGNDAVSGRRRLSLLRNTSGVLEGLPRKLVSRQVFLFPVFLAHTMDMGGTVVKFRGPLMVLVMRSLVITRGHNQTLTICPDLLWASVASL